MAALCGPLVKLMILVTRQRGGGGAEGGVDSHNREFGTVSRASRVETLRKINSNLTGAGANLSVLRQRLWLRAKRAAQAQTSCRYL